MKDIKDFRVEEEVRIREDIIVGFQSSKGVLFVNEMEEYKGKIVKINKVFSHSILGSIILHIKGSGYNWVPEFFADDPVIGVGSLPEYKEYSYKCHFPVMLGDKLIVDTYGIEKEVVVTNLNGDAKKATKYVRRKAEKIVFAYQSDTHWGSFYGPLDSKKATSIEIPDLDNLKLETARVDHPVAIETEDPLAISAGKERKGSGRCFTKEKLSGLYEELASRLDFDWCTEEEFAVRYRIPKF